MIKGGLPIRAKEVENIINNTSARFLGEKQNLKLDEIEFFHTRIRALEDLQQVVLQSELSFFNQLDINNGTPAERLKELQQRVDEINKINGKINFDDIYNFLLQDPQVVLTFSQLTAEAINVAFSSINWTFQDAVGITEEEKYIEFLIAQFSSYLGGDNKSYFANIASKGKGDPGKGIRRIFNIGFDSVTGTFSLSMKDNTEIDSRFKNRLIKVLEGYTQSKRIKSQKEFKKLITTKILDYIHSTDTEFATYLSNEISSNYDKYDLNRSLVSLRGFLQEVLTNALLDKLFGGKNISIPTGNIRNIITGAEIPIDAVVNEFHFQIKRYSLEKGKYTIKDKKEAGTFIAKELEINQGEVSTLLLQLFGSYKFNQPFKDETIISTNNPMTVQEYADSIYSKFQPAIYKLDSLFKAYSDKILRIDNTFQSANPLFGTEQLYYQTFFIINGQFVPASAMLQAIIESLHQTTEAQAMEFILDDVQISDNKGKTFEDIIKEHNFDDKRYSKNLESVANAVSLSYHINLDFDNIIALAVKLSYKN